MVVLGLVWLTALVTALVYGLSPLLQMVTHLIWIIFLADFALRFTLAPRKLHFLRHDWLTVVSLALPALHTFRAKRVLRMLGGTRGIRLLRILTSLNRGMGALGQTMASRGFGYVAALTLCVTLAGGAGMYAFERGAMAEHVDPEQSQGDGGLETYGEALWWTAMLLTTLGSQYWPVTPEGRLLALLLAFYALGVLGYFTAALASFFIGRDTEASAERLPDRCRVSTVRRRGMHWQTIRPAYTECLRHRAARRSARAVSAHSCACPARPRSRAAVMDRVAVRLARPHERAHRRAGGDATRALRLARSTRVPRAKAVRHDPADGLRHRPRELHALCTREARQDGPLHRIRLRRRVLRSHLPSPRGGPCLRIAVAHPHLPARAPAERRRGRRTHSTPTGDQPRSAASPSGSSSSARTARRPYRPVSFEKKSAMPMRQPYFSWRSA